MKEGTRFPLTVSSTSARAHQRPHSSAPWHLLNFFPLPHQHRWFLPSLLLPGSTGVPRRRKAVANSSRSAFTTHGPERYPTRLTALELVAMPPSANHSSARDLYFFARPFLNPVDGSPRFRGRPIARPGEPMERAGVGGPLATTYEPSRRLKNPRRLPSCSR